MFRTTACSLVLAAACAAPTFAQDQSSDSRLSEQQRRQAEAQSAQSDAAATADQAQPAAAREQAMQDPTKMFVMDAYNMNLFEIQTGQLAAEKAQEDQVKQFARTMVQDHTKANQQLKQVAQSANVQLTEQLDPVHQAKLQKMKSLPASELGRKYINGQAAGHMMSVLEFQHQSQQGQNPQVKQFATQMLPDLQKHLQHATQLAGQMAGGAQARAASERQSGTTTTDDAASGGTSSGTTSGTAGESGASAGNSSGQSSGQSGQSAGQSGGPGQAGDSPSEDAGKQ